MGGQMNKPYVLASDLHFHNWTAFSSLNPDGTNNRLRMLVDELKRACNELKDQGGDTLRIAGDVFHVRGSIAPSVLNVVMDFINWTHQNGFKVEIIAGNHDLEGKHSDSLGNAILSLAVYPNVTVLDEPQVNNADKVVMVPWIDNLDDLRNILAALASTIVEAGAKIDEYDLIIHAPLNGVIAGLPDKGLTTSELQALGFKRVFAGHYHNHKELAPNFAVTSIGALAHHTWSDVGSKAGYLIVHPHSVVWRKSHCPDFIDLSEAETEDEAILLADGNYVRIQVADAKTAVIEEARQKLLNAGARGVVIRHMKDTSGVKRAGAVTASVKSGASIHESVSEFVQHKHSAWAKEKVDTLNQYCQNLLAEASV